MNVDSVEKILVVAVENDPSRIRTVFVPVPVVVNDEIKTSSVVDERNDCA